MEALIHRPARNAMQSGRANTRKWVLEFAPDEAREADPLMGWIGSGDMLGQVRLKFDSCEAAVAFAEKKGLAYLVRGAQERRLQPKNYADRFRFDKVT